VNENSVKPITTHSVWPEKEIVSSYIDPSDINPPSKSECCRISLTLLSAWLRWATSTASWGFVLMGLNLNDVTRLKGLWGLPFSISRHANEILKITATALKVFIDHIPGTMEASETRNG